MKSTSSFSAILATSILSVLGVLGGASSLRAAEPPSATDAELISKPKGGVPFAESNHQYGVSKNGRFVVFDSKANNVVPGIDPQGLSQIFWLDRKTGETRLVSRASNGAVANSSCVEPRVSDDGKHVVFISTASNLGAPGNGKRQIFFADVEKGVVRIASKNAVGAIANDDCDFAEISGDGLAVTFTTGAASLVGPLAPSSQIAVYDAKEDAVEIVTYNNSGSWADQKSLLSRLSSDGRLVVYETDATNLPVANSGTVRKIVLHDRKTGKSTLMSKSPSGATANDDCNNCSIARNGRYVAFASTATNLTAAPSPSGATGVFVVDRETKKIRRVDIPLDAALDEFGTATTVSDNGRRVGVATYYYLPSNGSLSGRRCMVFDLTTHSGAVIEAKPPQLATASEDVQDPILSGNGKWLYFRSSSTALDKQGGTGPQIFRLALGPMTLVP